MPECDETCGCKRNRSLGLRRLGFMECQGCFVSLRRGRLEPDTDQMLSDMQDSSRQVDVLPAEGQEFATPKAGAKHQEHRREQPIVADGWEEMAFGQCGEVAATRSRTMLRFPIPRLLGVGFAGERDDRRRVHTRVPWAGGGR